MAESIYALPIIIIGYNTIQRTWNSCCMYVQQKKKKQTKENGEASSREAEHDKNKCEAQIKLKMYRVQIGNNNTENKIRATVNR